VKKVAIVTDSTCCIPQELIERYDIHLVPLLIIYEGKGYRDKIDITPAEVYKIMRRRKNLPTTSAPSPEDFLNAYRELSQQTESILCITVTGLQSGIFNMASSAREMAKDVIPGTVIKVIDSRAVERMLEIMADRVGNSTAHVMVQHADELREAEKLKAIINSRFNCAELYLTEFTPGMGVHAGPGVLGVSFYTD